MRANIHVLMLCAMSFQAAIGRPWSVYCIPRVFPSTEALGLSSEDEIAEFSLSCVANNSP